MKTKLIILIAIVLLSLLTFTCLAEGFEINLYQEEGSWSPFLILCVIVLGAVGGGIYLKILRDEMKIIPPDDAINYLVKDSYILEKKESYYLYTTTTRRKKQNRD